MFRSTWVKTAAAGAMAVGALSLGMSPAVAAPYWQPFVSNAPNQTCGQTTTHYASNNVAMQTCIFRNPANNTYQAVAVVVNNAPATVAVDLAAHVIHTHGTNASCHKTEFLSGQRLACYGPTRPLGAGGANEAWSEITLNNTYKDTTRAVVYGRG
ncbi:hypothetical protein ACIQXD_35785 [Streptomyces uncialis]|uniref:hypothetical protein n=1 Tax=Streptomyces uncialis TaxID=1048205 RepID=UPI003825A1E5